MEQTLDNIERMHFLLSKLKAEHGLLSVQVARAPENYFDLTLPERVEFLKAPSTYHLCKTIIMANTCHQAGIEAFPNADDKHYPPYVIVITQFEEKLNSQKILNIMKNYQHTKRPDAKVSNKGFHYRLSNHQEALDLSGY